MWKSTAITIVVYRRSWRTIFDPVEPKIQKRTEIERRPVESAAAVEIASGGLRQLFLCDFHKLLGKHKTLSTLPAGPTSN
jgi:hypothetical protein